MKKIVCIILLCLFSSSVNAGFKEIGNSYVSQETKDKINAQLENRPANIKVILYFYTDGEHNQVWERGGANEITDKLHKEVFKRCNKQIKKYIKKEGECSLYFLDNKVVWNFAPALAKLLDKSENPKASKNIIPKRIILEKDKKPGRFFEDQPDVNDDFQIHVIYSFYADSKDKENDISGKVEKYVRAADNWVYKKTKGANKKTNTMNSEGQRLKWDYRKDGKLDVSFFRVPYSKKDVTRGGNSIERTLINNGFNNPKKIYLNFAGFSNSEWPYSVGFPMFNIFQSHQGNALNQKDFKYFVLHEAIHSMTGISPCSPNHFEGHNTKKSSDMMSRSGDGRNLSLDPKNDDYWGHNNKTCPDMQDSVYFTPTSETPFDPFELACLPKEKWKITKHDYKNYHDRRGATYDCFYGRQDVTAPWEKELGIFQE